MATFSVDITEVVFAGTRTGYKDIAITGMPAGGVTVSLTGSNPTYFTYINNPESKGTNVYRVSTKSTYISSTGSARTATFKITNTSDSTDYVEVSLKQIRNWGKDNVYPSSSSSYSDIYEDGSGYFPYRLSDSTGHIEVLVDGYTKYTKEDSWISVVIETEYTDTGFKRVLVSCSNNYDGPREGTIYFGGDDSGLGFPVSIYQNGYPSSTSGCTQSLSFLKSGGTQIIELKIPSQEDVLNVREIKVLSSFNSPSIEKVSDTRLNYSFTVGNNNTGSDLRGLVVFFAGSGSSSTYLGHTIITQSAEDTPSPTLTVDPSSLSFSADAGSEDITFRYGGDTYSVDAKEVYTWTTVSLSDVSTGLVTGTVSVSTNTSTSSRKGNIYFSSGSESVALPIEQAGISFALSAEPSSLNIPAIGGSVTTAVTYTGTLSAASLPSWLSETHTDVDANHKTYTITAASNITTSSRTFNWRLDDSYNHCWVYFDQAAAENVSLSISPSSNSVSSSSGSVQITVRSTGISNVQYSISDSWITFGGKSGNVYTFNYEAKTSTGQRTGTITFSGGGITKTYTLTQEGTSIYVPGSLKVYPKKLRYYGEGGNIRVSFTNRPEGGIGYEIIYTDGSDWLSVTDLGPYKEVTATKNSGIRRRASIKFYDVNDSKNYVIVPVIQGNIDGYDSIWMDDLYYPENRNESGNYYYRLVDKKTNAELFTGISVIPAGYGENIGGIDTPRLVDGYISSNLYTNGSSDWTDMKKSYIIVDIYNMTESGYPGVVDATFKYFNDWSRFEKRYDYTRSLNDPINGKGCDNMIIPFCVYYDDEATFSIVDTEKNGNVNTYTLSTPSTPFAMRTDRFYDTKKLEYKQDDEVIFSYDMDHCGPGAFIYRNRFGGWDSFLIEGNIIKTDNYTKLNYRTKGEYNQSFNFVNANSQYKLEKHTDNVSINTTYEAYTGWLSDEEAERLVFHLLSSPMVFFQDLHRENKLYPIDDFVNMPIRITASSAEYKKFRNGKKMVNYLITFEKGHIEKVRN